MFHRQQEKPLSKQDRSIAGLIKMLSAAQFFADSKRQGLLEKIKAYSGLEEARYDSLFLGLCHNLLAYCQSLPATANSYYSEAGGLIDHALNRTEAALSLFQEFILQEQGERLSQEQALWQYALCSAAVLQGIGTLFVDYHIKLFDTRGHFLKQWNPLEESLVARGAYYDYEFEKESDLAFRRRLNLLIARAIMPESGFIWIASNPEVLALWLALLNEDQHSAGVLGVLLVRADAIAIQRYFNELLLRRAAKAGHQGRTGAFASAVPESIADKERASGVSFLQWLHKALDNGMLMINKAPLMMVPGGLVMCKELFELFAREHSEFKNWQAARYGLMALGLHEPVAGIGTQSDSFVLSRFAIALPNSFSLASEGSVSAIECINAHHGAGSLQKLSASGVWHNMTQNTSSGLFTGAKGGV